MGSKLLLLGLAFQALFSSPTFAAPASSDVSAAAPDPAFRHRAATCNTASDRACWTTGFNINTDYETSTPSTGVTRTYTLTLTEVDNWEGPDGQTKTVAMLVNNQLPGPVITADWGDRIDITVVNNLKTNGTSIHWHGLRQLNSNIHDGANGITECPIPPKGGSKVYSFLATQYGTSWYHSHFATQYGNGVFGSIVINGPASLPYDIDLGAFPIHDWYYQGADYIAERVASVSNPFVVGAPGAPPASNNILFNGTNVNPNGSGGSYARVTLTPGKRHRLRLINPSVENTFTVSIVGHSMTVIATDFVPVNAYTTNSLYLGVGQRFDVTIDASQAVGNYWINATFSTTGACGTSVNPFPAAILSYQGASFGLPNTTGTIPPESYCADSVDFSPVVTRTVPSWTPQPTQSVSVTLQVDTANSAIYWLVNGSAIDIQWGNPTLQYVLTGNTSYPKSENLIQIPDNVTWSYFLIQNDAVVPHPMHLHGHDFMILGRSAAPASPFTATTQTFTSANLAGLSLSNPTRRDVTMLPAQGWLVIAFKNDNPGAWLMHCHIAWHVSQGLSVQFLEKADQIATSQNLPSIEENCALWNAYFPSDPYPQEGSGLRM